MKLSIASALASLSGEDEACLCAFVDTCEAQRQAGVIAGWAVTRMDQGWGVGVRTIGEHFVGTNPHPTVKEATSELSALLIALGMQGAAQA